MNSFFSKFGFSAVYVYVEFFIGLVASVLIARTLGSEEFGVYSYLIRLSTILLVVVNAGVSTGVLRFLAEYTCDVDTNKQEITYNVYRFFSGIQFWKCIIVFSLFYFVLHRFFGAIIDSKYNELVVLFVIGSIFKAYYMFRVGALKGLERFDRLAWMVLAVCPLYLALVIIGADRGEEILYFSYVYLITSFLFWLISFFTIAKFMKKGEAALENNFKVRAKSYVKVVMINTVLGALVIGYIEIYFLNIFQPIENVGFFNIGLTISAAAVNLVPGIYNSMLMPAIVKNTVKHDGENNKESREFLFSTIRHMLILTLFVAAPAAFYAEDLISVLYGNDFKAAVNPLQMMLYASITTAFSYPAVAYFVSKDKQLNMLKVHVVMVIFSIICGFFLVKGYGLYGAVISYFLTTIITAILLMALLIKEVSKIEKPLLLIKAFVAAGFSILVVSLIDVDVGIILNIIIGSFVYAVLFSLSVWWLKVLTDYEIKAIRGFLFR